MSDLLAERYGAPRRARRMLLLLLIGTIAVAGIGWTAWAAWVHGTEPVQARVLSFTVTGPHQIRVRVAVDVRDDKTSGSCLLRATAADHSVVGELTLRVAEVAGRHPWVSVRTEREATTVEFASCTTS